MNVSQPDFLTESHSLVDDGTPDVFNSTWSRSFGLWLVAGYIALFIIRPWEVLAPWLMDIKFERNYAIMMILVVLATGRRWMPSRQCWTVIGFMAAVAISASFAWQSQFSWEPLYRYFTVVITYFLIVAVCRAPRDLFFLVTTYVAVMWVYLAKAIWEYVVHGRHEHAQSVSRLIGIEVTFGDPNAVAMSTVVALPMWWFLFLRRESLTLGWQGIWKRGYSTLVYTFPMISLIGVLLTNSRAGMVFLGLFVIILVFHRRKNFAKSALILATLLLLFWLSVPDEQRSRLETLWNPDAGPSNAKVSAEGRWEGFLAGMTMLQRFPVTGVGVGNFLPYRISSIDGIGLIAHNLPGEILGEMGALGGTTFVLMVLAIWLNSKNVVSSVAETNSTQLSLIELARANLFSLILLLSFGVSLHNGLRFNWIWIAAFAFLVKTFSDSIRHDT